MVLQSTKNCVQIWRMQAVAEVVSRVAAKKPSESFLKIINEERKNIGPPRNYNFLRAFDDIPAIKSDPKLWMQVQQIGRTLAELEESHFVHKRRLPPNWKFWEGIAVNKNWVQKAKSVYEKFQNAPKPVYDDTADFEKYFGHIEESLQTFEHHKAIAEQRLLELKEEIKNVQATSEMLDVMSLNEVLAMHPEWVQRMKEDMLMGRWDVILGDPVEAVEGIHQKASEKVTIKKIDDLLTYQQRAFQTWTTEKMNTLKDIAIKDDELDIYMDAHPTGHGGH